MNDTSINLKSLLLNAYDALKQKKYEEGKKLLEEILMINSEIFEVNFNLAVLNLKLGNIDASIPLFEKAKKLNSTSPQVFFNLGLALDRKKEKNLAIKNFQKVIELEPDNVMAHFNLGTIYKEILKVNKAEEYLKKCLDLKPNFKLAFNNLFDLYDRSNQLEKYSQLLKQAENKLEEKDLFFFYSGIHQYKKKNYKKTIEILENLKLNKNNYIQDIIKNGILAKSHDHLQNFSKAFFYFKNNNELARTYYGKNIDETIYTKYVDQRINFFENLKKNAWCYEKVQNNMAHPIFLIGFPRSGTTLLDTILRTNDEVEVIEEKPIIKNFLIKLEKKTNNKLNALDQLENDYIQDMRLFYFNEREQYQKNKKAKIVIDKLPLNVIHIGEILRFFPNAKFIFALRHPYDSVLSCFMQQFELNPAMKNFLKIESSAYLYDLVMKLWKIYLNKFSINFHYIKYEDVVINFETTTKKIFNYLSLNWSDKTKDFYITAKNRIDISTPSYNQVTAPIYVKSLNRWKNYRDYFDDSKKYLDKWVNEFDYEM